MNKEIIICLSHQITDNGNLSRDYKRRIIKSLEISSKKNIETIVLTGGVITKGKSLSSFAYNYLERKKIKNFINLILEEKSLDTVSEAIYLRKLLDKSDFTKLNIISSDWHIKRVRVIFSSVFNNRYSLKYFSINGFKKGWRIEANNNSLAKFKVWSSNCRKGDIKCYEKMLKRHHQLFLK